MLTVLGIFAIEARRETWIVAGVGYTLGIAAGLVVVVRREPAVLWLGLAGIALAFFYHGPPLKLSYRGLGELAVAVAYGPVIACGTYLCAARECEPRSAVLVGAAGATHRGFPLGKRVPRLPRGRLGEEADPGGASRATARHSHCSSPSR
jgi:hypothetical protein